jgi:hypothetical protein
MKREKAVVDAANVLHLGSPQQRRPSIKNIFAVMGAVRASGREPLVVLDPTMLSTVGESEERQSLLSESAVIRILPGSDAARVVLETAQQCDAIVVSNNTFVEYWPEYPWVELCRLPIALIDGAVRLLEARFKNEGYRPAMAGITR